MGLIDLNRHAANAAKITKSIRQVLVATPIKRCAGKLPSSPAGSIQWVPGERSLPLPGAACPEPAEGGHSLRSGDTAVLSRWEEANSASISNIASPVGARSILLADRATAGDALQDRERG